MRLPKKGDFSVSCSKHCHSGCGCNFCCAGLSCCNACNSRHSIGCSACHSRCSTGCNACGTTARVSGCHSCSGSYGLLRTVSGPIARSGCGCGNWNFPFYTGPCGPCNARSGCNGSHCLSGTLCDPCDCNPCNCNPCICDPCDCNEGCNSCCTDCCNDGCDDGCACPAALAEDCGACRASASFAAHTPVELAAGDSVDLSPCFDDSGDYTASREGVRIHRAGNYLAVYTVHIPANQAVSSRFLLTLDGARIEASAQDVVAAADCNTRGYTMHAMFHAGADSLLKLVSLNPVSIRASSASNVFTLSLTRIP